MNRQAADGDVVAGATRGRRGYQRASAHERRDAQSARGAVWRRAPRSSRETRGPSRRPCTCVLGSTTRGSGPSASRRKPCQRSSSSSARRRRPPCLSGCGRMGRSTAETAPARESARPTTADPPRVGHEEHARREARRDGLGVLELCAWRGAPRQFKKCKLPAPFFRARDLT